MHKKLLTTGGLAVALILFLALNILGNASLRGARADLTENGLYTLSEGTKNILRGLHEEITLRFYFSKGLSKDLPTVKSYAQRVQDMLEEYVVHSGGKLTLIVADPEPFSEEEDRAVGFGLQGARARQAGDLFYFGLAATNTTDDTQTIPFFSESREEFLEYDLTKLVYALANPERRVVGLITRLPMEGGSPSNPFMQQPGREPWFVVEQIQQLYEVRSLPWQLDSVPEDVDLLMIVHPKDLPPATAFAIDQFVLGGGHALVCVDPFCEADQPPQDPQNPMAGLNVPRGSTLEPLFASWGVKFTTEEVAADRERALRVGIGQTDVEYIPWIGLRSDQGDMAKDSAVSAELDLVHLASAGILEKADGATTELAPLLQTSTDSMRMKSQTLQFQQIAPDPGGLLDSFASLGERLTVAARVSGPVKTAFPEGRPKKPEGAEEEAPAPEGPVLTESKGPINVIVIADADLLQDRFWVRVQNFLGQRLAMPIADNGDLVLNAVENLSGSNDLISLRSRGRFKRPFDRVAQIRRDAETRFRAKESEFKDQLRDTERKISELQQGKEEADALILSPEQRKELERLRDQRVATRKSLRDVQHQLNQDIEKLGSTLKLANILGAPLAVVAVGLASVGIRRRRQGS